jgi:hypothetical protein
VLGVCLGVRNRGPDAQRSSFGQSRKVERSAAQDAGQEEQRGSGGPAAPGRVRTLTALARELKPIERAVAEKARYQLRDPTPITTGATAGEV